MLKFVYIVVIISYLFIIGIWCYRYLISYRRTTGIDPDLITHNLTDQERENINKAYRIRKTISNILLYSSVVLSVGSYIILRNHWIDSRGIVKTAMVISGFIAIILILVNGIHFIPGPPIR